MLAWVSISAAAQAAAGGLDSTFSGDGKQMTDFERDGIGDGATGVARQGNGKIVAVGHAGGDFALARYSPNGTLDPSFSGDGKQTTHFAGSGTGGSHSDGANAVAIQPNGQIIVAGRAGGDFALARYNPNGSLDNSFGHDGKRTTDFGRGEDGATGVAIQGNGKILVVGHRGFEFDSRFAVARYNPDGTLDTSFSGDGRQTTFFYLGEYSFNEATGVALQADGKILVVGRAGDFEAHIRDFALVRYNPNGSLDASFSGDGQQTTNFVGDYDEASGVALQSDGKIIAVGRAGQDGFSDFALARYDTNGTLDASFSADGKRRTHFGGRWSRVMGVALQGDGKIVVVGAGNRFHRPSDFALARYNPNGSLDPSFSGNGKLLTNFVRDDWATGVALQGAGKIVAVGVGGEGQGHFGDFALARYLGG